MRVRVSEEEFAAYLARMGKSQPVTPRVETPKPSKYHNQPVIIDGERFDSKGEAAHWQELKLMERAGLISDLKRQVEYPIEVNGIKVCSYRADYVYLEKGVRVVGDYKGVKTEAYALKKKLLYAVYGIAIKEVSKR